LEPGVFGIYRPVLLLPEGIFERLTPKQLQSVIAHELCHIRYRDNLIAAIHMLVETVLWFHPLVWWIGKRMIEERERACDEEVLRLGSEPHVYAEGILNICKSYVESPLVCVSGVTGSNLKKRIEAIMANRVARNLSVGKIVLLVNAAVLALAGPIVIGVVRLQPIHAQTPGDVRVARFEVSSVKPVAPNRVSRGTTRRIEPGSITYLNITLGEFITMAYEVKHYQLSGPNWIVDFGSTDRYDLIAKAATAASKQEIQKMLGPLLAERFHLVIHRETREFPVYALVVTKNGPKFKPGDGGPLSVAPDSDGGFYYKNYTMEALAESLSLMTSVARPVLDRTGLKGAYSFNADIYNLAKGLGPAEWKEAMVNSDAIFSTLPDQLGLKLESQKAPIDIIAIDRADKVPIKN
jgi:uncharacterized protein (TIGR03435 family)